VHSGMSDDLLFQSSGQNAHSHSATLKTPPKVATVPNCTAPHPRPMNEHYGFSESGGSKKKAR
jgi:hypothetical protein